MTAQTIGQVRDSLKAALTGLVGVTVYDIWPNNPATIQTPAILVKPKTGRVDASAGKVTYEFELTVACQATLPAPAQDQLDDLLSFFGATTASIFSRLWANTNLAAANVAQVEYTELTTWHDYGGLQIGVQEFIGAVIDVEVATDVE